MQKLVQKIRAMNRYRILRHRYKSRSRTLTRNLKRPPRETKEGFQLIHDKFPFPDECESANRELLCKLLPNVSLFVNVGANVGFYCCMAQSLGVRTIALEPEPANCQFLCKNLSINGFANDVEVLPVAAGRTPPRIAQIFGSRDTASLSAQFNRGSAFGQFVPVFSLDDIVLGHRWVSGKTLLMIDVEGWEQHVLEGARGLLGLEPKPFWIIEILPDPEARRIEPTQAFAIMFEHGYRAYRILRQGDLVEVTEESVYPLLSQEHDEWNYLFIDNRLSVEAFI